MVTERSPNVILRQLDPQTLESQISASLIDAFIFELHVNAAREARIEAARNVARSRALRAEADQIVDRSRGPAIQLRATEIRTRSAELPSPRKIRSLYVQAQHEYQRFFRLATELTEVIEQCAESVTNSARFRTEPEQSPAQKISNASIPPVIPGPASRERIDASEISAAISALPAAQLPTISEQQD